MISFQMGVYCAHPFFQVRSVQQQGKDRLTSIQYYEWKNTPNQPLVTVKKIIIMININIIGHIHLVDNKFEKMHDNLFFIWHIIFWVLFSYIQDMIYWLLWYFPRVKIYMKITFFSVGELNLLFSLIFMYYHCTIMHVIIYVYFSNILICIF